MRADTLKAWLEDKGCRFDQGPRDRGEGHATLTVKLKGRESTLPKVGTHEDLKPEEVQQIVNDLGLEKEALPGSEDSEPAPYKNYVPGQYGQSTRTEKP